MEKSISLSSFLVLGVALLVEGIPWTPQRGTVSHPKLPELSSSIRRGDVINVGGKYYRALQNVDFTVNKQALEYLPDDYNELWRHIQRGDYLLPRTFGSEDAGCDNSGDLFSDGEAYYRYRMESDGCTLEEINEKENWMSLLRSEIGDTRLGDLLIPGSHDSGTSGIDSNSILVDRNFLFQVAERLDLQFVANWSLTHDDKLGPQLMAGFRQFDLRIADTEDEDGLFRWWHGLTGDEITEGLQQIGQFAQDHPEEILILNFQHFAKPGNMFDPTQPVPLNRLDMISDMILQHLGDKMTYRSSLSSNPTVNEVLATGRNIVALMTISYIKNKDDRYWENVMHSSWSSVSNPEELFGERSAKLRTFKDNYSDQITDLSGATTADEKVIIAGLLNVYGNNETIRDIIEEIVPGLLDVNPANMSYEGLWTDLFNKARFGTNTDGMHARQDELFSSGASVQYFGVNGQARHWLARPDLYKPNIIYTDDFLTSTLVDLAIEYNRGDIGREVSVVLQGNPKTGYFEWDDTGFGTIGGQDGVNCTSINLRYTVSDQEQVLLQEELFQHGVYSVAEGTFPVTSEIQLEASSDGSAWNLLSSNNLQQMISTNFDVYVRGSDFADGGGFAYISTIYDDYGDACELPPSDTTNIINLVEW